MASNLEKLTKIMVGLKTVKKKGENEILKFLKILSKIEDEYI